MGRKRQGDYSLHHFLHGWDFTNTWEMQGGYPRAEMAAINYRK
jgi:hypothetical protein